MSPNSEVRSHLYNLVSELESKNATLEADNARLRQSLTDARAQMKRDVLVAIGRDYALLPDSLTQDQMAALFVYKRGLRAAIEAL